MTQCIGRGELASIEVLSLRLRRDHSVDLSHYFSCKRRCTTVQPKVYSIDIVIDKNQIKWVIC